MGAVSSGLSASHLKLTGVPDIRTGQPTISPDGLTYTFKLRHDARFSNGDPITADDFIYSWNRAAAKQGDYAGLFGLIAGYQNVAGGKTHLLSGRTQQDHYTRAATLI